VAIIQIKPQLEKVLKLPNDSLTKEIQLSQDLMNLFIEYQIPSDLISYQGDENATQRAKVDVVKGFVANMQKLIADSKATQLKEAQEKQAFRFAENDRPHPPPPIMPMPVQSAPPMRMMAFGGAPGGGGGMPMMASMNFSAPPSMAPSGASASFSYSAPAPAPPPSIQPAPQPQQQSQPQSSPQQPQTEVAKPAENIKIDGEVGAGQEEGTLVDYTKIPNQLEKKYEELDVDGALRPTIINPGSVWTKRFQKSLLAEPDTTTLSKEQQGKERNKAFDLLDALTKSGSLTVESAALHVVIAATHCFDKTLVNTIIQDNVNPIEKVERSSLIMASTIHGVPPKELILTEQVERIALYNPMLIANVEAEAAPSIAPAKEKEKEKSKSKK